jgi:type IX secretion system PorP/SprF family membrane protein
MMNEFIINPAVAGVDGRTTYNFAARKEWLGMTNLKTPTTFAISAQTRLLKQSAQIKSAKGGNNKRINKRKGRVGLGASLYSDGYGALNRTGIQLAYSYHITSDNRQFSFGLTGSIIQLKFYKENMEFVNNEDEIMLNVAESPAWMPDFSAGFNFTSNGYHLGASVSQILQSPFVFGNSDINYRSLELGQKRNYYFMGAVTKPFPNNGDWEYEPSFLFKMYDLFNFKSGNYTPGSQLDASVKFYYMRKYWFGASYRTMLDYAVMGGLKFNNIYFSYSFDHGTNELLKNSYGSHEIAISIKFGDTIRRYRYLDRY